MTTLSDAAVARLRQVALRPDPGPRYVVHELLGRGGMGAVYRATDQALGRDVALKVLGAEHDAEPLARQVDREARLLARLEHPGIVPVHDTGTLADGRPFYVMRLVRGERLDARARREGRGELVRRFIAACDAVSFAHARGVVHRDLTPSNVMVGEFGEVLVLDWGIATAARDDATGAIGTPSDETRAEVVAGTPGYMAPEQLVRGSLVDGRADVYSLGVMLRTLLALRDEPMPRPLAAVIAKATAADAEARYGTVDALAADVRAWLDAAPVKAYREPVWERALRFYRRNDALIVLVVAYLVVRLLIFWWRGI